MVLEPMDYLLHPFNDLFIFNDINIHVKYPSLGGRLPLFDTISLLKIPAPS